MSMRWRKVLGDARRNGAQVALVALVLVMGTAGVVAALDARAVLGREIAASYESARAPDLALWFDKASPEILAAIAHDEDVAGVEARRVVVTRVEVRGGSWLPMRITVLGDIDSQSVARVHRHDPARGEGLWIEQSGEPLLEAGAGKTLRVRTPTGGIASVPSAGFVHDTTVAPSTQERIVYAFATPAVAAVLGQSGQPDQAWVRMKDRGDASALGESLRERLRAMGAAPLRIEVLQNAHPHASLMNAMLRVLAVASAIAFTCGAALAGYLVSSWMKREVRLVGVMKAIGARPYQVAAQYLLLVGPVALAAAAIAIPFGAALGRAIVGHYATVLNIDIASTDTGARLPALEAAVTIAVALAAMAWPIARASRMSVREALQDAGIASPLTAGSRLAKAIHVPGGMLWTLAVRNTLRRPLRLTLALFALASGGALLLTTHSNYESLMHVIDASLAAQGHDVEVFMPRAAPAARLEEVARGVADVAIAEAWRRASVTVGGDDTDAKLVHGAKRAVLYGFPASTRLFRLPVVEGRLPALSSADEVVMTRSAAETLPGLRVGGETLLRYRDRRANVRVVGVVDEIGSATFYGAFEAFDAVTGVGDASTVLRVKTQGERPESVAAALDRALLEARLPPGQLVTRAMFRDALDEHFKVVGDVIRMVALAAALVGAIILAASTSFNVLERTREVGVMRAIGATPRSIAAVLLVEGAAVAVAGAALSIALSLALTLAMNGAAARNLLHVAVPLRFSLEGLAILLAGAVVVVAALGATLAFSLRRTVTETLSFEG